MQIYDHDSKPLLDLLRSACADDGATLLVPDLQRPYVWTPDKVTLLVDSLLRGWPFGTLLLWDVKKEDMASIPSRPFWRVVDRTGADFDDEQVGKSNPPAEFRMVLDGQQRLQSLILAFVGDNNGFRLLDEQWSTVLEAERPRGKYARKHWSLAHLCLDVWHFKTAIAKVGELAHLEFRDVLQWAVLNPNNGRSAYKRPVNYKYPVPSALDIENKGRFIRLSRLWKIASERANAAVPRHFHEHVGALLNAHDVPREVADVVLDPLSELALTLRRIQEEKVSYLWLKPFNERDFSHDVYNDAIVNIFTRLNTAGRALSRQEITFAWIKTGWDPAKTDQRTAGKCFDELREQLKAERIDLGADDVVAVVSAMWSVLDRKGELLTANDLLRGEKVRPMAQQLVARWSVISSNLVEAAQILDDRGLEFGTHYLSLNVFTLLSAWRLLGRQWVADHPLSVTVGDSFEKSLAGLFTRNCDRWLILSQWSGRWGKSTDKVFAEYVAELASDWEKVRAAKAPEQVLEILRERMDAWLGALRAGAEKYIDDLRVLSRNDVHQYYMPLWLWHRLDADRWDSSKLPLRESKRGSLNLDVDHIVAVKLWEAIAPPAATITAPAGDEADEAQDAIDVVATVNAFGNCCLLEKSFNIAKGAEPLRSFLERIHEFKHTPAKIDAWGAKVDINEVLLDPRQRLAADVAKAIEDRTARMKTALKEFAAGARDRVDIGG
ncbi:DUF262 domain-containing protein [Sorangium sp. So ce327]|uniref:DUF262 domain-containing protein n=1 Tax=Sorangium sp. So ce327 TaxID=3133301 RepID=UPI003F63BC81